MVNSLPCGYPTSTLRLYTKIFAASQQDEEHIQGKISKSEDPDSDPANWEKKVRANSLKLLKP